MRYLWLPLLIFALGADGDPVGPTRNQLPDFQVSCRQLCDNAVDAGTCTMYSNPLEDVDEWHFFASEDDGCTAYSVDINNFLTTDTDAFTLCTLTETASECRWFRARDGTLNKHFQGNVTSETGCTGLDITLCFIRYPDQ